MRTRVLRHIRTTVEITNEQRAKLLELAAARGQKGFSFFVREAIDRYLATESEAERKKRTAAAIGVLGTLEEEAADRMEKTARELRGSWR